MFSCLGQLRCLVENAQVKAGLHRVVSSKRTFQTLFRGSVFFCLVSGLVGFEDGGVLQDSGARILPLHLLKYSSSMLVDRIAVWQGQSTGEL